MAHVILTNLNLDATHNSFTFVWKLTRALKAAGAVYRASGNGTSKDSTANPDSDLWNGSGGDVPSQNGSTASMGTIDRETVTVTGLSGMTSGSVGHYLTLSGASSGGNNGSFLIVEYLSSSSVRIRNSSAVSPDANDGSISWTEKDPLLESYPTGLNSVTAWWFCYGVATLKVPVNTAATGTFLRGETVTQANSLAEGELLGFMYDSATPANSFLVILPRIGTFNGSDTITGSWSSATIDPSASPVRFEAEFVFWKTDNTHSGTMYYARSSSSDTSLNSLVASAGCTASVPPGGGGTGNSFPATATALRGTGGSASHAEWIWTTTPGAAKYHLTVTNMIGLPGLSPDGTFWVRYGMPSINATASHGFGHFRMDDTEEGDVDPFLSYYPGTSKTRTANTGSVAGSSGSWSQSGILYNSSGHFQGWRRRSFSSADDYQVFEACYLGYNFASGGLVISNTFATPESIACHTQTIRIREPLWAATKGVSTKMRKGTFRWMALVPTGSAYDTWDGIRWAQTFTPDSSYPGLILGPLDGSTSPVQSLCHMYTHSILIFLNQTTHFSFSGNCPGF